MHFSKLRLMMFGLGGFVLRGAALAFAYRHEIVISMVSRSRIEANVPPTSDFDADLARDLQAWFSQRQGSPATVHFELLRRGATQSGVSFPKYYAWVEVRPASGPVVRGAVRVAAVERDRFEGLQFLSADEIR